MSQNAQKGASIEVSDEVRVNEDTSISIQKDFGSEQLPTNVTSNPWDELIGRGGVSPSGQVAGETSDPFSSGQPIESGD